MGWTASNNKCLLTGLESKDVDFQNSNWKGYEYEIDTGKRKHRLLLSEDAKSWFNDPFFIKNKHIIAGLILNDNWIKDEFQFIEDIEFFKNLLKEKTFPKTPKDKRDFLFLKLFESLEYEGQEIKISLLEKFYYKYFLVNFKEFEFYLNSLCNAGFIAVERSLNSLLIRSTFEGLNYAISIQEEGPLSNNCFIAMSFSDNVNDIRAAIKTACEHTLYNPIFVDEAVINSDATINDAIISNLRKCKFCIADFTEQKYGVYFESGYALGQGKKVIYTCREEWFNGIKGESHFDTNHFPHIIYKDSKELTEKLIDRINAWM